MKKPYKKPMILFETFDLMEHIANCMVGSATVTYRDKNSCTYTDSNITMFNAGTCQLDPKEYEGNFDSEQAYIDAFMAMEGYTCYNAFTNGQVFAS